AFLGGRVFLGSPGPPAEPAFLAVALVLLGAQLVQVGLVAKTWYHVERFYRRPYLDRLFRYVSLEAGLLLGAGLLSVGGIVAAPVVDAWREGVAADPSRAAAALLFLVLGVQAIATSVILSVLGIRRR
ncbi:MAG: hypothetical protein ACREID_06105, partial [Planctomycetota bacterium]